MKRGARRRRVIIASVVALLLVAIVADVAATASRVKRVPLTLASGRTWLIIGSDSRADVPTGPDVYGTAEHAHGSRADVVMLVTRTASGTVVAPLPRDLIVQSGGHRSRLTLTLESGPQAVVSAVCTSLGVPVAHVGIVDMRGFADVVDAVGGIDVTVPAATRDRYAALSLPAGTSHVDGVTALAFVRSRHPERLEGGHWTRVPVAAGAAARTEDSAAVLAALRTAVVSALGNPIGAQRLAWAASGAITLDSRSQPSDLLALVAGSSTTLTVPTVQLPGADAAPFPSPATRSALAAAGFGSGCR